jgi:hypothetical protein
MVHEVRLTSINVQSDLDESAGVQAAIHPLVDPLHEAQVGIPEVCMDLAILLVTLAVSLNTGTSVEADKVGDSVLFVAANKRVQRRIDRTGKVQVNIVTWWAKRTGGRP